MNNNNVQTNLTEVPAALLDQISGGCKHCVNHFVEPSIDGFYPKPYPVGPFDLPYNIIF